jgi:hypothetical protein
MTIYADPATTPAIRSECPFKNFVALWITTSNPGFNAGCRFMGFAKVASVNLISYTLRVVSLPVKPSLLTLQPLQQSDLSAHSGTLLRCG